METAEAKSQKTKTVRKPTTEWQRRRLKMPRLSNNEERITVSIFREIEAEVT